MRSKSLAFRLSAGHAVLFQPATQNKLSTDYLKGISALDMSINGSCEAIRRFIQEDRLPQHVYSGQASSQMRSSLDVIEDCQLAIDAYFSSAEIPESGECYTKVYGILQVLFVQQNAVRHLFESLHQNHPRNDVLDQIRKIRNRAVGHPTKKEPTKKESRSGEKPSFHFISRVTLPQDAFQLITESEGAKEKFEDVDIRALITDQDRQVTAILTDLVTRLGRGGWTVP